VHVRSEGDTLVEAAEEVLGIAAQSGATLKISHLKASGPANWRKLPEAVAMIELAAKASGKISFDVYPYDFVWQVLYIYLPKWAYQAGRDAMVANLKNPETRAKILSYLASARAGYADLVVASTSMSMNVNGKTLGDVAGRLGTTAEDALLTLLENGGSEVMCFDQSMDIRQVQQLVLHPLSVVATDGAGFPVNWKHGLVHPRSFGTMPTLLEMSLRDGLLPVEAAVHKVTGAPADLLGLKNRGRVAPGYAADLVVFSPNVHAAASMANPYQLPSGIELVVVNGNVAVESGQLVADAAARSSGSVLRKGIS
jgi:N-acyl-D-amino-acid deacylase